MGDEGPRKRYYYTPAELYDLSYSPLVAPPASLVKIAEEDLPGPPCLSILAEKHGQAPQHSRRNRGGTGNNHNNRRQDRRWVAGSESFDYYAGGGHNSNSHGHHGNHHGNNPNAHTGNRSNRNQRHDSTQTEEAVAWLDITTDSKSTGFDNVDGIVDEFEKWKEAQRGGKKSPIESSTDETGLAAAKDSADSKRGPSVKDQSSSIEVKELWETAIETPREENNSTGSRFSTFFQPPQAQEQQRQKTQPQVLQQQQKLAPLHAASIQQPGTPTQMQPQQPMLPPHYQMQQVPQAYQQQRNLQQPQPQQAQHPQHSQSQPMQPQQAQNQQHQHQLQQRQQQHQQSQQTQQQRSQQQQQQLPPGMGSGIPAGMSTMPAMSQGAPPGMAPPGMAPPGMVPPGLVPPGMVPPGMVPPGMMPPGMVHPGMVPPGISSSGGGRGLPRMPPPGMSMPRMVPQGINAQQSNTANSSARSTPGQGADDAFFMGLLAKR